jgi:membrane-bound lytic murein transglycosylase A
MSSGETGRDPAVFAAALLLVFVAGVGLGFGLARWAEPRQTETQAPTAPVATYTRAQFTDLAGWTEDRVSQALPAMLASCSVLAHLAPDTVVGTGAIGRPAIAWQAACERLSEDSQAHPGEESVLRQSIEQLFVPYWVAAREPGHSLFTGYYEADLNGSLTPSTRFHLPIYGVPRNLVTADLKGFFPSLSPSIPRELVGRVVADQDGAHLVPYYTRADIEAGDALAGQADVVLWADDPVAVHLLHIQGSGRATLPDGSQVRLAFAGHNGRAFRGVAGILVAAGIFTREDATMDRVRDWLESHPAEAGQYLSANERFIFFRRVDGDLSQGPRGALSVPLTPGRSLAVDPQTIPLGAPVWLETTTAEGAVLQRLMSAQDTGAAIVGAVRGDVFWGRGDDAFMEAARMRSPGRYAVLLPREAGTEPN